MPSLKDKKTIIGALLITMALVAAPLAWYQFRPEPPIPQDIQKQLSFAPFVIAKSGIDSMPSDVKYDSKEKLLSYNTDYANAHLIISEQATPESFSDVPQAYPALLDKLHQRDTIDTLNGQVTITYPKELNGTQTAVMNSKGTLIFVRSNTNLNTDQWRKFFNNLVVE